MPKDGKKRGGFAGLTSDLLFPLPWQEVQTVEEEECPLLWLLWVLRVPEP